LDSCCSHGPVGRSHMAGQLARSERPQPVATAFKAATLKISAPEDREKRQKQTQDNAQNDAGNDGKVERGMFALDPNVAGQSAEPLRRETTPHD